MSRVAGNLGRKALAFAILAAVAYLLFELVVGFVSAIVWIAIAALAVIAVIWALRTL